MRNIRRCILGLVSFGLMVTVGCSTNAGDEPLTDEEMIAETIEQGESIDSYANEMGLYQDFTWEDGSTAYDYVYLSSRNVPESSYSRMQQKYGNEETDSIGFTAEIYRDAGEVYRNRDNEGWRKEDPRDHEYEMTEYEGAISFLESIERLDELTIEETESEYEISHFEENEVLSDVFIPPSTLKQDGTSFEKTGTPETYLRIDKEDYTIREFTAKFFYEEAGESEAEAVLTNEALFDEINEIEDIEIPDEVIEEAEQYG